MFSQKCLEVLKLDPPFLPPSIITAKIKVLKTMPIWVFRCAQRSGKLPEAWFRVSAKLTLGCRSKKHIADMAFSNDISAIGFFGDLCARLNTHIGIVWRTFILAVIMGGSKKGGWVQLEHFQTFEKKLFDKSCFLCLCDH